MANHDCTVHMLGAFRKDRSTRQPESPAKQKSQFFGAPQCHLIMMYGLLSPLASGDVSVVPVTSGISPS